MSDIRADGCPTKTNINVVGTDRSSAARSTPAASRATGSAVSDVIGEDRSAATDPPWRGQERNEAESAAATPASEDGQQGTRAVAADPSSRDTRTVVTGMPQSSVWLTAQRCSRDQRRDRYLPLSMPHPGKMLPEIARQAIAAFTAPGDIVADPMAGIGTTLIEAMHLGRHALGVEYERRWVNAAEANARHANANGASGGAHIWHGDGAALPKLIRPEMRGRVALVLTSPPYGPSTHGRAFAGTGRHHQPVAKHDHVYGSDKNNLAYAGMGELTIGFTRILQGATEVLRPGGIVAVTARPFRRDGELVDVPGMVLECGRRAGLTPVERICVLLAGVSENGQLISRGSFFQMHNIRAAAASAGPPQQLVAFEDLIVFQQREQGVA